MKENNNEFLIAYYIKLSIIIFMEERVIIEA